MYKLTICIYNANATLSSQTNNEPREHVVKAERGRTRGPVTENGRAAGQTHCLRTARESGFDQDTDTWYAPSSHHCCSNLNIANSSMLHVMFKSSTIEESQEKKSKSSDTGTLEHKRLVKNMETQLQVHTWYTTYHILAYFYNKCLNSLT